MKLRYDPLLPTQRRLQGMPRDLARFKEYLRTIMDPALGGPDLVPLLVANPMGKDHVTTLLDDYLALDADGIAARTADELSAEYADEPGEYDVALVVVDDLLGGWTNRYATEHTLRFHSGPPDQLPTWTKRRWCYGVLWSSEPATAGGVAVAMRAAIHRFAYVGRHGLARTLRDQMRQEGYVMARAGCDGPTLDADDLEYTREVIRPYLDADDVRTTIQCLFGDEAGRTLGFPAFGLSAGAGLALALSDARAALGGRNDVATLVAS